MNMRPGDEVAGFVSRVRNYNPCTPENLRRMAPQLTEAAALILPESHLDVIAYSCTSGEKCGPYAANGPPCISRMNGYFSSASKSGGLTTHP